MLFECRIIKTKTLHGRERTIGMCAKFVSSRTQEAHIGYRTGGLFFFVALLIHAREGILFENHKLR